MERVTAVAGVREAVGRWRGEGGRVALVPTMGNLHEGHLALMRRAREVSDFVVVSIFVNPLQFTQGEDYDRYPRTPEQDHARLEGEGVDLLFEPGDGEVYQSTLSETTRVEVPGIGDILCGAFRPGHFTGVATVVNMLLNMVQPHIAIVGQKDYQQFLLIRRMVDDLRLPVEVTAVPTVREADGLAMSSRNRYLRPGERQKAPLLYQTLSSMRERILGGERDYPALERDALDTLSQGGFRPEYLTVRRAPDLAPPGAGDTELVLLGAAWMGPARLIDNVLVNAVL